MDWMQKWNDSNLGNRSKFQFVEVLNVKTGQMLEDRTHHTGAILCLLLVKDRVWSSARDKSLLIWSPKVCRTNLQVNLVRKLFQKRNSLLLSKTKISLEQLCWK